MLTFICSWSIESKWQKKPKNYTIIKWVKFTTILRLSVQTYYINKCIVALLRWHKKLKIAEASVWICFLHLLETVPKLNIVTVNEMGWLWCSTSGLHIRQSPIVLAEPSTNSNIEDRQISRYGLATWNVAQMIKSIYFHIDIKA